MGVHVEDHHTWWFLLHYWARRWLTLSGLWPRRREHLLVHAWRLLSLACLWVTTTEVAHKALAAHLNEAGETGAARLRIRLGTRSGITTDWRSISLRLQRGRLLWPINLWVVIFQNCVIEATDLGLVHDIALISRTEIAPIVPSALIQARSIALVLLLTFNWSLLLQLLDGCIVLLGNWSGGPTSLKRCVRSANIEFWRESWRCHAL